jgi:hypothetical protein
MPPAATGCSAAERADHQRSMKTFARPADRAELLQRLKRVRPQSAPRWGRMSAHQMVCHLADGYRIALGRKPVACSTGIFEQTIVKWFALYAPLRWPPGVRTAPELDQECGGSAPSDFAADAAELEALLDLIAADPASVDTQLHPLFGRMSRAAWLRWAYLHMDHHLRQFGA